jgi:hypothetical protein
VARLNTPDVILPYSAKLELPLYPNANSIADAMRHMLKSDTAAMGAAVA